MLACVSERAASTSGKPIVVEFSESSRWPGGRPVLITNDTLRDHTLLMRDPVLARKWYDSVVLNFLEADVKKNPRIYQRRIQGNPSLLGMVWHFPVKGWGIYERLLVHIPTPASMGTDPR